MIWWIAGIVSLYFLLKLFGCFDSRDNAPIFASFASWMWTYAIVIIAVGFIGYWVHQLGNYFNCGWSLIGIYLLCCWLIWRNAVNTYF